MRMPRRSDSSRGSAIPSITTVMGDQVEHAEANWRDTSHGLRASAPRRFLARLAQRSAVVRSRGE